MSNINKQALREAAQEATGAHARLSVMPAGDIFDISQHEGTQLDADITALNAFNEAANPVVVLALLDDLEKMQAQSSKWCEAFHKAVSVGARYEERIAELEAREILLPERSSMLHRTDFNEDYQTVMAYKVSDVIAAIRAAGIRIKGE